MKVRSYYSVLKSFKLMLLTIITVNYYIFTDRNVLRLHVARSGNLFILFAGLNRARRGQLERCWSVVVVVTPASVGRQDSVASANRGLSAKRVSKPPDERSTCVETKASQALQLGIAESWLTTFDRAPLGRWSRVFTPRHYDRLRDGSSF